MLAIIGLAAALRLPAIDRLPAHIDMDELLPGLEALDIARHPTAAVLHRVGWFGMPSLTFAFPATVMRLVPVSPFYALRLSSALMGLAGIVCTFLLGRQVVGSRPALLGAFLMAVSFWHLHNSRTGFPFVQTSFCTALVLYLSVRAQQRASLLLLAVAGVCLGLSVQCYFPTRILLILVPLVLLVGWLDRRVTGAVLAVEAATVLIGAIVVLIPIVTSVPLRILVERSRSVFSVDSPAAIARHTIAGLGMFTNWAELSCGSRSSAPLLDGCALAAFAVGALVTLREPRSYTRALLLSVVLTFVFGVALTDEPRASYRLGPAMPPLFLVAGLGADYAWRRLTHVLPRRRYLRAALAATIAATVLTQNCYRLFIAYARGDGRVDTRSAAWRFIATHCDGRQFYLLAQTEPLGSAELLHLFCPAVYRAPYRLGTASPSLASPGVIEYPRQAPLHERNVAATFLVGESDLAATENIRRQYRVAEIREERAADGSRVLTTIDVLNDGAITDEPMSVLDRRAARGCVHDGGNAMG